MTALRQECAALRAVARAAAAVLAHDTDENRTHLRRLLSAACPEIVLEAPNG